VFVDSVSKLGLFMLGEQIRPGRYCYRKLMKIQLMLFTPCASMVHCLLVFVLYLSSRMKREPIENLPEQGKSLVMDMSNTETCIVEILLLLYSISVCKLYITVQTRKQSH
jgi:hypothetical protein